MDKKRMILEEAKKLFVEKGYYGLGLAELLSNCHVPKGSFYYYFPGGKIQLISEVLWDSYLQMENSISSNLFSEPTAIQAFEKMTYRLEDGVRNKRHLASLLLSMISIESVYLDEGVNHTCQEIYARWQKFYADRLKAYGYDDQESQVRAQAIFALIHGSLISSWIKQDPEDLALARNALPLLLH